MNRKDYNQCMVKFMTGGGPGRKERFCIGAKKCSGKASNDEEARKLCAEAALNPKPPRAKRNTKCFITPETITCIIKNLNGSEVTPANLMGAVTLCTGPKP